MTADKITRLCYSAAIGALGAIAFPSIWGLALTVAIIVGSNLIGAALGDDS